MQRNESGRRERSEQEVRLIHYASKKCGEREKRGKEEREKRRKEEREKRREEEREMRRKEEREMKRMNKDNDGDIA